jgi:purine catabolism regulator
VLTLEQLISEVGVKLATGHDAAGVAVRWVHSTELLDPTPWLSGGELLLTTGIQLTDEAVQREFVERLAAHGIAGLGLGVGFTHAGLPAGVLAAAADLGFPVFEVPYELPFIALTERASAHLVNEQYEALRRSVAIQARLERLVLEERGLGEVVAAVAGAVGGAAGVLDAHGEVLAWSALERDVPASVLAEVGRRLHGAGVLEAQAAPAPLELRVAEPWEAVLALPVVARDRAGPHAWLVATRADRRLGDFERLILQQTVTVVALELMRRRIEGDTERRLAGDILAEALTGRLDADELGARLRPFGIGESAAVLAFALEDPVAAESQLARALERAGVPALVATRGALLCAVIDATGVDPVEIARQARAELRGSGPAHPAHQMRAAASRAAPVNALRRSFHEARCALEAVRLRNGTAPEVASHVDLGAFHLLLSLQDDDALRSYCQGVLAPVEEGDNGYGDELLRSLDAYIEHNGHWERAAAALYCHRHTLRYRIRRVEELTGRDFGNARDRIEFWLALRGRELAR